MKLDAESKKKLKNILAPLKLDIDDLNTGYYLIAENDKGLKLDMTFVFATEYLMYTKIKNDSSMLTYEYHIRVNVDSFTEKQLVQYIKEDLKSMRNELKKVSNKDVICYIKRIAQVDKDKKCYLLVDLK